MLEKARYCDFGLFKGSADIIGVRRVTIGQEHVGMTLGVFVSAEVKRPGGRLSEAQKTWARMMDAFGALAGRVESPAEVHNLLDRPDRGV